MDSIIRGTTPMINVTIPGLNDINPVEIWFSFRSGESVYTFKKSIDNTGITVAGETISKLLSQEDTLNFNVGILYMQVRLLDNLDMAFATPLLSFTVEDVIQGGEMNPPESTDEEIEIDVATTVTDMYEEFGYMKDDMKAVSMSVAKTVIGNPVTAPDAITLESPSLLVTITPSQEGSGEPSSSNIRSLVAHNSCSIVLDIGDGDPKTITVTFGENIYGGVVDFVSGTVTVTHGYYQPYAGESLNEPWISDRDPYVPGSMPSAGASVCYLLDTPRTINVVKNDIEITSNMSISSQDGEITLYYATNIRGEIESMQAYGDRIDALEDTVEEHAEKLLPDVPNSDGTYHLRAVVLDGVATYSWIPD